MKTKIKARLEYLRRELRAEQISYFELYELQALAHYIEPGDVELLEAAGVPEFSDEKASALKIGMGVCLRCRILTRRKSKRIARRLIWRDGDES